MLAPLAGRISDRVGRRLPYVIGLSICAFAMVVIAVVPSLEEVLAGLIVTSLGAGLCFAPALTLISDVAEASSLHQGFAAGLSNMAWASGQVIGGVGGGVVASLTGNAAPSLAISLLLVFTVFYAFRALQPGADPAPPRVKVGRWRDGTGAGPASGSTGPAISAAGRRGSSVPPVARSWRRRSPPRRPPARRSGSPAPATPSPRRR